MVIIMGQNKAEVKIEPGKQELFIIRDFDFPRGLVFKAFTDPKLYREWVGLRELETEIEIFQPVDGGSWKYIQNDQEGNEFAFHGVNHEVLSPERIISTFEFDGLPEKGHVLLQTTKFESISDKRTRMVQQSVFQSVEDRDGMLISGMEKGVDDSFQRLDELLESMENMI